MTPLLYAMIGASLAGAAIPAGALTARFENIHPRWLELEFRHSVIAFGGGVLFAAVALVLVPEGTKHLSPLASTATFGAGGLVFLWLDRIIATRLGSAGQLLAMVSDFVPEALALGALFASGEGTAPLLVALIGLQNFPEGFNAYRELRAPGRYTSSAILWFFTALVMLGPIAALIGHLVLVEMPSAMGAVMLFAAGGILYLTFQDIAPQAHLRHRWAPALGAVAGFMLGLWGHMVVT